MQMKKHELKAIYQTRTMELLAVSHGWSKRYQAVVELEAAEQQLRMSTLSAMDTALRIYSDLYQLIRSEFSADEYEPYEYIDEQSLNILQKCVEMCMPNTTRARAIANILRLAHGEGYIDENVGDYVDEFHGGLEDAIRDAEREMGGSPYYRYFASEDEFPSEIPQQPRSGH